MDKDRKEQLIIKICCVIAAFALWLFITGTENPLSTYKLENIHVQLLNTDVLTRSNLILVPGQDLTTALSIKGASTSVLVAKKAEDFTVVADLSAYALKNGEQKIPIEIRKSPDNINVVNSDSLFVTINLDELTKNKLPINVTTTGKPKEGFYASSPKLSVNYATVTGGSKLVNIVKKIVVEENIQGLEADASKQYKLKALDDSGKEVMGVSLSPAYVNVQTPVRKTKSVGVTVKTTGSLSPGLTLESIKVLSPRFDVTGSVAQLDQLVNLNTEAIDLSKIDKSTTMDAKLLIPTGLRLVSGNGIVKVQVNLNNPNNPNNPNDPNNPNSVDNVDKVIQKNLNLDIKYNNLDEKYNVKLENSKTSVVISGAGSIINSLDLTKIAAQVDLTNLTEGEHTVPVTVSMPTGVNLVSAVPNKILVTITKKQTEVPTSNDNTGK